MRRYVLFVGGLVVVSVMLVMVWRTGPQADGSGFAASNVTWQVEILEPVTGLVQVRGEIPGEAIDGSLLVLRFLDLRRHPEGLRSLRAWSGDQALRVDSGRPSEEYLRQVHLDGGSESVLVEYTIDPTYYPPGSRVERPADARSRVARDLAVLRSSSLFPVLNIDPLPTRMTFALPDGWVAVAPWNAVADEFWVDPDGGSRVEYLGVGPFEVRELSIGDAAFRVAAIPEQTQQNTEGVAGAIRYYADLLGAPPSRCAGVRTVIVVPPNFMRGGAAGRCSVVQSPSPEVIAHEVFHWWTHAQLVRPEARWFSEGFTNYYGVKAAREGSLMTEEQAALCLADLWGEMQFLERDGPLSLSAVSADYDRDSRGKRLVYSKGTLFALLLDRELAKRQRSLDEAMRVILSEARQGITNSDLRELFDHVYGDAVDASFEAYVQGGEALPDLGLGPATGRSGCARYLLED
jgi:hypothetical protein